jgi:hypothetical protein
MDKQHGQTESGNSLGQGGVDAGETGGGGEKIRREDEKIRSGETNSKEVDTRPNNPAPL